MLQKTLYKILFIPLLLGCTQLPTPQAMEEVAVVEVPQEEATVLEEVDQQEVAFCTICRADSDDCEIKLSCGHKFHKECLEGYYKSQAADTPLICPYCRNELSDEDKQLLNLTVTPEEALDRLTQRLQFLIIPENFERFQERINILTNSPDAMILLGAQNAEELNNLVTPYTDFIEELKRRTTPDKTESIEKRRTKTIQNTDLVAQVYNAYTLCSKEEALLFIKNVIDYFAIKKEAIISLKECIVQADLGEYVLEEVKPYLDDLEQLVELLNKTEVMSPLFLKLRDKDPLILSKAIIRIIRHLISSQDQSKHYNPFFTFLCSAYITLLRHKPTSFEEFKNNLPTGNSLELATIKALVASHSFEELIDQYFIGGCNEEALDSITDRVEFSISYVLQQFQEEEEEPAPQVQPQPAPVPSNNRPRERASSTEVWSLEEKLIPVIGSLLMVTLIVNILDLQKVPRSISKKALNILTTVGLYGISRMLRSKPPYTRALAFGIGYKLLKKQYPDLSNGSTPETNLAFLNMLTDSSFLLLLLHHRTDEKRYFEPIFSTIMARLLADIFSQHVAYYLPTSKSNTDEKIPPTREE